MRNFSRFLQLFQKIVSFGLVRKNLFRFLVFCVRTILWISCEKKSTKVQPPPHDRSLDPPLNTSRRIEIRAAAAAPTFESSSTVLRFSTQMVSTGPSRMIQAPSVMVWSEALRSGGPCFDGSMLISLVVSCSDAAVLDVDMPLCRLAIWLCDDIDGVFAV